ncbi:MAG: oligosaccharide flippase family protein [bacterium]|nr:oligosaccharide flippase family protein [bacterium]
MSNSLKNLAGQTVVYGLGTILPRLLNYLLTPLLTYTFKPAEFGINSEIFAYIAFLNIIFIYGMETTFFNFNSKNENKEEVFNTSFSSLITTTVILSLPFLLFAPQIAELMSTPNARYLPVFIVWSVLIIASDAFAAIPYARLRSENKALKFSLLKLTNIVVNLLITVFFLVVCKTSYDKEETNFYALLYNPEIGIGYVFLATLIANLISILLLSKQIARFKFGFNMELFKEMLRYTWPLIILGLAGNINDTADRVMIKWLVPDKVEAQNAQGVYGACYKIAILMNIFIQAFRFAAEPFFFNKAKDKDSKIMYAVVMKYFVIFCLLLFLGTVLNLDWIKYFVDVEYRVGLKVVPILLIAYLCLGVMINLSIWFKLSGQTKFGAVISIFGAVITVAINFIFVPEYSYMACAWATLLAYSSMMVLSYVLGQRYFPIKYNVRAIGVYAGITVVLYLITLSYSEMDNVVIKVILNNLLILVFVWTVYKLEISNFNKLSTNVAAPTKSN